MHVDIVDTIHNTFRSHKGMPSVPTSRSGCCFWVPTRRDRPFLLCTHTEPSSSFSSFFLWKKYSFLFSFFILFSLWFYPSFLLCVYFARGEDTHTHADAIYSLSLSSLIYFLFFGAGWARSATQWDTQHMHCTSPPLHTQRQEEEKRSCCCWEFFFGRVGHWWQLERNERENCE